MGGKCCAQSTSETYEDKTEEEEPSKPSTSINARSKQKHADKQFAETMEFISIVPLFKRLPPAELPRLAAEFLLKTFEKNKVVIKMGELGDEFFVIKSGEAKVTINDVGEPEKLVATLKRGDYFGEASLLKQEPRNATVTAVGTMEALTITRENFDILEMREKVRFPQRKAVVAIHKQKAETDKDEGPTEKTADDIKLIESALRANEKIMSILRLDSKQIDAVVKVAWKKNISQDTQLIKQGDLVADHVYIVNEGSFDIFIDTTGGSGAKSAEQAVQTHSNKLVAKVTAGACFGELALLYHAPRAATVQATEDSQVWCIGRTEFKQICMNKEDKKLREIASIVNKIDLFQPLLEEEREVMAKSMVEVVFSQGDRIIEQGAKGDTFWLLIDGEVEVVQDEKVLSKLEANFNEGECPHFGERALLSDEPRAATVLVQSARAVALCLDRDSFNMTLGSLNELLKSDGSDRTLSMQLGAFGAQKTWKAKPEKVPKRDMLQTIGLLGVGGFGSVTLEKDKNTGKTYALKSISKGFIVKMDMQDSVMNEKSILQMTDSRFIIKLFATYNTGQFLLFLMEAALGGELFSLYHRKNLHGRVNFALFYSACVIKAFEHLHERRIIYRDLKPENLLLDDQGYCKLTDMGLAKFVVGKTYTTCGTPDYFAPEVIGSSGHSRGVDWWTLGILIYELMTGHPPFETADPMLTYKKIMQGIGKVRFNRAHFSEANEDIVTSLCKKEPSERLPMKKDGLKLLAGHDWYKGFGWEELVQFSMVPPLKIKMKNNMDCGNFYAHEEDAPPHIPYVGDMTKDATWDKNFATD